jgi:hypothetical protein
MKKEGLYVTYRMWIAMQTLKFQQHAQICVECNGTISGNFFFIIGHVIDSFSIDPFGNENSGRVKDDAGCTHGIQIAFLHGLGESRGGFGFSIVIEFGNETATPFVGQGL